MCGIAGIVRFRTSSSGWGHLEHMANAMQHRGPDAAGYYNNGAVTLAHRRLSIIDLSEEANQPMADHSGRYHIVFNGEIYNFREVKQQLPDYPYQTKGDTEVILAAYTRWGSACLEKLDGMFALAIWDEQQQELFMARDRLGVKPLYYYHCEEGLVFASEIRALLASGVVPKTINTAAVTEFLQFQSVGHPHTIIKDIWSLEAGSYMIAGKGGLSNNKYWQVVPGKTAFDFQDETATGKQVYDLLQRSVERRLISDVPLGAFLSGGIDSSAIVGLMASVSSGPVNTFNIGFQEKDFDESEYASLIAKKFNTRHHAITLKPTSFLDELVPALDAMDTPSGDGVNSYVVSKAIRESGITVALSGVGGDELFAGYPIFKQYLQLKKYQSAWPLTGAGRRLLAALLPGKDSKNDRYRQLLKARGCDITQFYPVFRQILTPAMIRSVSSLPVPAIPGITKELQQLGKRLEQLPLMSQVSVAEYLGYTQHTLLKDMDQMSMAVSLEVREPFFDHHLVEFVLQIPDNLKYPVYPKKLLVASLGDLLPPEIVHRRKQGFLFPWKDWMKKELADFCDQHIRSVCERDFIKSDILQSEWKKFRANDPSVRWLEIWLFVILDYWLQKNSVA